MNDKDFEVIIEKITSAVFKKIKNDAYFKNVMKVKNATVVSSNGDYIEAKFPYDDVSFSAKNETGVDLIAGNVVCIEYWIDLKNAVAIRKVN